MARRIEDYGLIGDLETAALVSDEGSIDWLCLPRFDAPACFASLLGGPDNGFWRIAPVHAGRCTRRNYRGDTLILETYWESAEGVVRVVDAMPQRGDAVDVVRVVECLAGRVSMQMQLRLRFDYGRVVPWVRRLDGQLLAVAGPDSAWLSTPVETYGRDLTTYADFDLSAGDSVPFVLTYRRSYLPSVQPTPADVALRETEAFWSEWIGACRYEGRWGDAVRRSLITLKALTHAPTGGIIAAATTSLPEQLGGTRNWDYRYTWLRDATLTLEALLGAGYVDEAKAWREWLLRAAAGEPAKLQIMYGLDGAYRLPEYELTWLAGYEGSGPVRIGNAASEQLQLDVWGEVLTGLHLARQAGIAPNEGSWDLQQALLDYLEGHWHEPDNGLWEVRGQRRHFVHSKVMAWAGVDRAVQAVERFGREGPAKRWRALADEIHADVCRNGYDAERQTFTQFYGSRGLDAALLLIGQVGFLPWHDPRVAGTVRAVQRELNDDGFLLRYDPAADGGVDGLPGEEGVFLVCTFWLVDALHGIGRTDEAVALFERLLDLRNDLGLLSEEYDARLGRHLGNTPQAFSHIGLVNSARRLSAAGADPLATMAEGR